MNLFCRSSIWMCLFSSLTTPVFAQGSLTPPGPPGPTMKSLDQTEPRTPISTIPFRINQPGSYYVTTNLFGSLNDHGIIVATNDVTIDLNGFALIGFPSNLVHGIIASAYVTNVAVRNGALRNWTGQGVDGIGIFGGRYQDLQVSHCGGSGISVGPHSVVKHCSVGHCGAHGIAAQTGSTISDCTTHENGQNGITLSRGTVVASTASQNAAIGFSFLDGSSAVNCFAFRNLYGFVVGDGSTLANCSASQNSTNGIRADYGATVRDCTTYNNHVGIFVGFNCRIVNNNLFGNSSAGILVTGSDNRIDGNQVTASSGTGILANPAVGNLVIRNTCSGNAPNFNVHANNVFGPVVTTSAALTNASPWANIGF